MSPNDPLYIVKFAGPYEWLSNFARLETPIRLASNPASMIRDLECWTVEHAYQVSKTYDVRWRWLIAQAPTPKDAKRLGRRCPVRYDFEAIKIEVMRGLLRDKFRGGVLSNFLLETKNAILIEGNDWGDNFWGCSYGRGFNVLGRLIMEVREELRDGSLSP